MILTKVLQINARLTKEVESCTIKLGGDENA